MDAYEKGFLEGHRQGFEDGIAHAEDEFLKDLALYLLDREVPIDDVCALTDFSLEELKEVVFEHCY